MSAAIYTPTPQAVPTILPRPTKRSTQAAPATPPLTPEQKQLILIRRAQSGDTRARDRLLAENIGLLKDLAYRYTQRYQMHMFGYEDLLQEAVLGFWHAVELFNPLKHAQLPTYATYWIRAYILDFLEKHEAPRRMTKRAAKRMSDTIASDPARVGILSESTGDPAAQAAFAQVESQDAERWLVETLLEMHEANRITTREVQVISLRFAHSLNREDIGKRIGVSREHIRQIEIRALAKLKCELARSGVHRLSDLGMGMEG